MLVIQEKQQFRQWWVWLVLLTICTGLITHSLYQNQRLPILPLIIIFGVMGLLYFSKLTYVISLQEIRFRFFPIMFKQRIIPMSEVDNIEFICYNPILDYGGWGIRYGRKSWAYTITGKKGILITLNNGSKILLGTQKKKKETTAILSELLSRK